MSLYQDTTKFDQHDQVSQVLCSAAGVPHNNTVAEDALYCATVEVH